MKINRLLILSFYYDPDLSAGSFRTSALVRELLKQFGNEVFIDVLATLPNRYSSLENQALLFEQKGTLAIYRIKLPQHKSGMLDQAKAFKVYAFEVLKLVEGKQYDAVFATSSRLLTASLGSYIAKKRRLPIYLDIRDIFVDTIGDVLPKPIALVLTPLLTFLEKFTIGRAKKVNLVSEGFLDYFKIRYPKKPFSYYSNGIDAEFIEFNSNRLAAGAKQKYHAAIPTRILYAGNIGEGQGLHLIVPELARLLAGQAVFRIIGDGGRKLKLAERVHENKLTNVQLLPPVKRGELLKEYSEADVLFIHLNDYEAFKKVLPSKVFEYASTGKPILAGVAGYAAEFLKREVRNAVVFDPCSVEGGARAYQSILFEDVDRSLFINKFSRENIMRLMASDIISVLEELE